MSRLVFILGGARSGKSSLALRMAQAQEGRKAFLATAQGLDEEMRQRIKEHQRSRPPGWDTFEEPLQVARLLRSLRGRYQVLVLDCLGLWVSNLLQAGLDVSTEASRLLQALGDFEGSLFVVSNEVGSGLVPPSPLGRSFRDALGWLNQMVAQEAQEVFFLVAGIPMKIKGGAGSD